VAIFDEDGNFIKELVSGSRLAAPWGITLAPPSFGRFGIHLLVGNFSFHHSAINAFNPIDGKFQGTLPIRTGGMRPGGLWTIEFGSAATTAVPIRSTSLTVSTARRTGCWAPHPAARVRSRNTG
jgi:hypothetical protein